MISQPELSSWSPAETSRAAAVAIKPDKNRLRELVWNFLNGFGPSTDEEIQRGLSMSGNTERARRGELVDAGRVVNSGETRKTESGRMAIVWRVV